MWCCESAFGAEAVASHDGEVGVEAFERGDGLWSDEGHVCGKVGTADCDEMRLVLTVEPISSGPPLKESPTNTQNCSRSSTTSDSKQTPSQSPTAKLVATSGARLNPTSSDDRSHPHYASRHHPLVRRSSPGSAPECLPTSAKGSQPLSKSPATCYPTPTSTANTRNSKTSGERYANASSPHSRPIDSQGTKTAELADVLMPVWSERPRTRPG
jgi:hypothetical protein